MKYYIIELIILLVYVSGIVSAVILTGAIIKYLEPFMFFNKRLCGFMLTIFITLSVANFTKRICHDFRATYTISDI